VLNVEQQNGDEVHVFGAKTSDESASRDTGNLHQGASTQHTPGRAKQLAANHFLEYHTKKLAAKQ
jgi:hypothetical protein